MYIIRPPLDVPLRKQMLECFTHWSPDRPSSQVLLTLLASSLNLEGKANPHPRRPISGASGATKLATEAAASGPECEGSEPHRKKRKAAAL